MLILSRSRIMFHTFGAVTWLSHLATKGLSFRYLMSYDGGTVLPCTLFQDGPVGDLSTRLAYFLP